MARPEKLFFNAAYISHCAAISRESASGDELLFFYFSWVNDWITR
jgi:hypothetical protein